MTHHEKTKKMTPLEQRIIENHLYCNKTLAESNKILAETSKILAANNLILTAFLLRLNQKNTVKPRTIDFPAHFSKS